MLKGREACVLQPTWARAEESDTTIGTEASGRCITFIHFRCHLAFSGYKESNALILKSRAKGGAGVMEKEAVPGAK